jgi:hypothetical protein
VRAVALAAALVVGLAACGGSGEPKKELLPGTLTIGAVVASARDRVIAHGARIDVGEMNSLGGIAGKVRVRFVTGPDAGALVRRGARAVLLPCEPADQARAEAALRGRRVFAVATCNSWSPTKAWGAGPSLRDRVDGLFATLRDRHVDRAAIAAGPAAATMRRAAADWGVDVTPTASTVVTGSGWGAITQRRPVYGLDRLDSAAGIAAAGAGAEGVTFATFGYPVPGSELDELYEKYRLDHGARPDGSEVQLGYDGVHVIGKAVEQAKTTDPAALAANLPGLSIGGAGGVLDYPEDGSRQPRADIAVVQVRDGRLELLTRGRPERP